jgi:hypothetical protein
MTNDINLKEIERKAFRSTFQDGLWDLFLGLVLLILATAVLLSDSGISEARAMAALVAMQAVVLLAFIAAKKLITVPRMGLVKFGPKRKRKLTKVRAVLLISVVMGAVLFIVALFSMRNRPEWLNPALVLGAAWVANCIVVFSLGAYFLDLPRLYAYGVLFAMPVPGDFLLRELAERDLTFIAFGVPALVILVVGAVMFIRFLRQYQLPPKEVSNVNAN